MAGVGHIAVNVVAAGSLDGEVLGGDVAFGHADPRHGRRREAELRGRHGVGVHRNRRKVVRAVGRRCGGERVGANHRDGRPGDRNPARVRRHRAGGAVDHALQLALRTARADCGVDRRHGVDLTPARGAVRFVARRRVVRTTGGGIRHGVDGALEQHHGLVDVALQAWRRFPHQGDKAGYVRRRHRGAAPAALVVAVASANRRTNIVAGGADVRLEVRIAGAVRRAVRTVGWAPVGECRIGVAVAQHRSHARRLAVTRRVADRVAAWRLGIPAVGGVAVGEHRVDPLSPPRVDHAVVPGVVRLHTITPGVVHHIRMLRRIRHGAVGLGWRRHELRAGQQTIGGARSVRQTQARHPLGAWRHADLVGLRSIFTHHGAHRVGAVVRRVARRRDALAVWVKPVVIVGEGTVTVVAAVLSHQRIVRVPHAAVDVRHHQPVATEPHPPDLVSLDECDVRLDRLDVVYAGIDLGLEENNVRLRPQLADLVEGKQFVDNRHVRVGHIDDVVDPERLVLDVLLVQIELDGRLGLARRRRELIHNPARPLRLRLLVRRRQIRLVVEVNEVAGGGVVLQLGRQLRVNTRHTRSRSSLQYARHRENDGSHGHCVETSNGTTFCLHLFLSFLACYRGRSPGHHPRTAALASQR